MVKSKKPAPQAERDRYQEVTDKLLAIMESGRKPWTRPWDNGFAMSSPVNATTGTRYKGINHILLMASDLAMETGDPRWCTFQQAKAKGWNVKKGSLSETVFFYKKITIDGKPSKDENEDDSAEKRTIPILKAFPVFHASQIENIPEYVKQERKTTIVADHDWTVIDDAQLIAKNSNAEIRIGGDQAFYRPAGDFVMMPPKESFLTPEHYAATLLHELGHWTSHEDRLNRQIFFLSANKTEYAKEELRAELASAFIGAELGLTADLQNHASYLDSWLNHLRQDKREIFRAARDAQRIADYILNFHPDYDFDVSANQEQKEVDADSSDEPTMKMAI